MLQRIFVKLCKFYSDAPKILQKCYDDECLTKAQVFRWSESIGEGREAAENELRSVRALASITNEKMLKENLGWSRVLFRLVPYGLNFFEKHRSVELAGEVPSKIDNYLECIFIGNKTWNSEQLVNQNLKKCVKLG